jgi:hypothetical protein
VHGWLFFLLIPKEKQCFCPSDRKDAFVFVFLMYMGGSGHLLRSYDVVCTDEMIQQGEVE